MAHRVQEAINLYVADMVRLKRAASTQRHIVSTLTGLANRLPRGLYMSGLDADKLKDAFYEAHGRKHPAWSETLAGSTFNKYRDHVNAWLAWCHRRKIISTPARDLMEFVERSKVADPTRPQLPEWAALRMVDAARWPRNRALVATGMCLGFRAAELQRVKIGDYDPAARTLVKSITKSSSRSMQRKAKPLTPYHDAELRRWLAVYAAAMGLTFEEILTRRDWFLFPSHNPRPTGKLDADGKPTEFRITYYPTVRMGHAWQPFQDAMAVVGVTLADMGYGQLRHASGRRISTGAHTARRTVAMGLYAKAGQVGPVQALLDHEKEGTTSEYIGVTVQEQQLAALQADGGAWGDMSPPTTGNVVPIRKGLANG